MTGFSIRVTKTYCGSWILEGMTGQSERDPVRVAAAWTREDAALSFQMLIGAMEHTP